MTGKVIDSGANSILLVILPLALIIMVVFVFWPLLVGIFIFALGYKLWQRIRLKQLSEQLDPIFNQLIQANKGCLTVIDLTSKANLNAKTARWYLENKTQEYGAVKRLYEGKGIVYYFLTANALGSIFDDSEPDSDTNINASVSETKTPDTTPVIESPSPITVTEEIETPVVEKSSTTIAIPDQTNVTVATVSEESFSPPPAEVATITNSSSESNLPALSQSELAKRLEVSPTTIAKRKSQNDFSLWSQSRDPDGVSWQYVEETKLFVSNP